MKFRTELHVENQLSLKADASILFMGSCFAERMGTHFLDLGMNCMVNPFGVIYNPITMSRLLSAALEEKVLGEWEESNGSWVNCQYHGEMKRRSLELAQKNELETLKLVKDFLLSADVLVLTLGTSYAYFENESATVVANCHRFNAQRFTRSLLEVAEMASAVNEVFEKIRALNSKIEIILTISPVRHVRDSLTENQLSKSSLIVTAHQLSGMHYFPAYEIMMDDLRDYRFYDENLVLPNTQALVYIREKFATFAYSKEMYEYEADAVALQKRLSHRVLDQGPAAERFHAETKMLQENFLKKYSFSSLK